MAETKNTQTFEPKQRVIVVRRNSTSIGTIVTYSKRLNHMTIRLDEMPEDTCEIHIDNLRPYTGEAE